jgi:hypothetical protein
MSNNERQYGTKRDNMAKAKLHEILAVESDLRGQYEKIYAESKVTFEKKGEHFLGFHKSLKMFDVARENEEAAAEQHKELVTTVDEKLRHTWRYITKYFDCLLQKESTNAFAKADLVIDDVVLGEQLPATFLLGMEQRLKKVRELYEIIPTLQPGIAWVVDTTQRPGVFRAQNAERANKTEQVIQHKILVAPTDNHPAQIEKWSEQLPVGVYTQDRWTGMISPARKAELLERLDTLIAAIKKARQRANQVEVVKADIAQKIFNYIHS